MITVLATISTAAAFGFLGLVFIAFPCWLVYDAITNKGSL